MHTLPRAVALVVLAMAFSACSPSSAPPASSTPPPSPSAASQPATSSADSKAELRDLGELVFGQSWLSGYAEAWPAHAGELSRRTGLCADAWAKNPRTPITGDAVAKANISIKGAPDSVCIVNGSLKLAIVAEAIKQAVTDGIPVAQLTSEATQVLGDGSYTGLAPSLAAFTPACRPASSKLVPATPKTCQPAAKALAPVLDQYRKLEADWAAAIA